jgi:hypothetical protein
MLSYTHWSLLQEIGMCWHSDHLQQGQARELPTEDRVALEVAGLEQEVVMGVMAQQILQMDVTLMKETKEAVVQQISFLQKLTQEQVHLPQGLPVPQRLFSEGH